MGLGGDPCAQKHLVPPSYCPNHTSSNQHTTSGSTTMIDTTTPWAELEQQPAQAPLIEATKVHDHLPESEPNNHNPACHGL